MRSYSSPPAGVAHSEGSTAIISMPRLSDSMSQGVIARWLKATGDEVRRGEEIVEIETDKATVGYESDFAGTLEVIEAEGATVSVGAPIAFVRGGAAGNVAQAASESEAARRTNEPSPVERGAAPAPAGQRRPRRSNASPVARRLAERLGVELAGVGGTGPFGRILKSDVRAAHAQPGAAADVANGSPATRIERLIAQRMTDSRATIPTFEVEVAVDATALYELHLQYVRQAGDSTVPSINDLVVKGCAAALRGHSRLNGSYTDDAITLHDRINIGIAVEADDALVVPTIFDADRKSLGEIAANARVLVERARSGTLTPADLSGGTFTISNLGMFGVSRFSAIINPPQAAILAVGAALEQPVSVAGEFATRRIMRLTITCDHRLVYGAHAARFLAALKSLLESPLLLTL